MTRRSTDANGVSAGQSTDGSTDSTDAAIDRRATPPIRGARRWSTDGTPHIEPLGRGEAPTLDDLAELDERDQPARAHPSDEQFVADMAGALDLDLRDPDQRRQWLATYNRAQRRRKATLGRRGGRR